MGDTNCTSYKLQKISGFYLQTGEQGTLTLCFTYKPDNKGPELWSLELFLKKVCTTRNLLWSTLVLSTKQHNSQVERKFPVILLT